MFLIHIFDILRYEPIQKRNLQTRGLIACWSVCMTDRQADFIKRMIREEYDHEPF